MQNVAQLVTGSGDENVKVCVIWSTNINIAWYDGFQVWCCMPSRPSLLYTFECNHGAVLSVAVRGETVYAGCQDGYVQVLDLETHTLVRTIIVQEVLFTLIIVCSVDLDRFLFRTSTCYRYPC
jgi:di- and tripeptidase